jgi:phosphate transport system permease protein
MSAVQTDILHEKPVPSVHTRRRNAQASIAGWVFGAMTWFGVVMLVVLLYRVLVDGWPYLKWNFITNFASYRPEKAGIKAALVGSAWMLGFTALISIPLGVGAAIYLEEYARNSRFSRFVEVNISNLAGVPSIVYGLLGLSTFVYLLHLGRSVLAASLTMSLLILPVIITASREAIKAVPSSIRYGAFALGATRWEVITQHVLPVAIPGILTGLILSMSRALGEAAPMVLIAALSIRSVPHNLMSDFTVLPIQIFNWASRPKAEFQHLAAAGITVLMVFLMLMNSIAIYIRYRAERKHRW